MMLRYLLWFYSFQCAGEEAEVDAKASLDTCEEVPQQQDEPPQPKPRKKKKAIKRTGNWIPCGYRLPVYARMHKALCLCLVCNMCNK